MGKVRLWLFRKLARQLGIDELADDILGANARWYRDLHEYLAANAPAFPEGATLSEAVRISMKRHDLILKCELVPGRMTRCLTEDNVLLNRVRKNFEFTGELKKLPEIDG